MPFLFFFATMPYQLVISTLLLLQQLGWVFVVGLAMLCANTLAVDRLGIAIKNNQIAKMGMADGRSVVINESIQAAAVTAVTAVTVVAAVVTRCPSAFHVTAPCRAYARSSSTRGKTLSRSASPPSERSKLASCGAWRSCGRRSSS